MLFIFGAIVTWLVIFVFAYRDWFPSSQALYNNGKFVDSFFQASIATAILFGTLAWVLKTYFGIDPLAM